MRRAVLIVAAATAMFAGQTAAQEKYPTHPVRILVPYAPGGATDIAARLIADQLQKSLGQPFIVENKQGADGVIAIKEMFRSKPGGYTLMVGNVTTNAMAWVLFPKRFSFNYEKSVVPVARISNTRAFLIATSRSFPAKSMQELIAFAKQRPGEVRYGVAGIGAFSNFDMVLFAKKAGIQLTMVPYKGAATPIVGDMLSGEIQLSWLNAATVEGLVKSGQLRALAVVGSQRLAGFPNVPTMAEAGFPDVGTVQWQAMFAPAETPAEVLDLLNNEVRNALKAPAVQETFAKLSVEMPTQASSEELRFWFKDELSKWRRRAAEANIEVGD